MTTLAEVDLLLHQLQQRYPTEVVPITVAGHTLKFARIRDLDELIVRELEQGEAELLDLPFWGKIWEASLLLAAFLAAQPVLPGRKILEIGAGVGVSGLFAAAAGHQVELSDFDDDVLAFLRANVLLNGMQQVPVLKLDWRQPAPEPGRYQWIVGAEVVYHRPTYASLVEFLDAALAPGGTIFIAKSSSLPAQDFFTHLTERFHFKFLEKRLRSGDEEYRVTLYAIKRKGET